MLRAVSWWAFGTLPPAIREMYGVRWSPARQMALRATLRWLRLFRPAIPPRFRHIMPAQQAVQRVATG